MLFEHRRSVIEKLSFIEKNFSVEKWKMGDIYFWPALKNQIFFFEYRKSNPIASQESLLKRIIAIAKVKLKCYFYLYSLRLESSLFVFAGSPEHRLSFSGVQFNRYFDPIIDYLKTKKVKSFLTEYKTIEKSKVSNPEGFIDVSVLVHLFKRNKNYELEWKKLNSTKDFQDFQEYLKIHFHPFDINLKTNIFRLINEISNWKRLYLYLFKRVKPKFAIGLCYYSNAMYGMNAAASELNIVSIDMQHGTQGPLHNSYNFSKIPKEGYNILPREFWCWDETSANQIQSWASGSRHIARLTGNPWITFLKEFNDTYEKNFPKDKPVVLYTHQPLKPTLDLYLLDCIKQTKNLYHWWIRLHPRISKAERDEFINLVAEHNLLDVINYKEASNLPLPIILDNVLVHISKYSGAVLEGVMMGVPTIILEEVGMNSFSEFIRDNKAIGLANPNAYQLSSTLKSVINSSRKEEEYDNYKEIIDGLIENIN